ncbi:hypothetical protein HaLaN_32689, partial [Haematococcus lacustris]|jgi:hypothetical protein
MEAL